MAVLHEVVDLERLAKRRGRCLGIAPEGGHDVLDGGLCPRAVPVFCSPDTFEHNAGELPYSWREIGGKLEMDHSAVRRAYFQELGLMVRSLSPPGESPKCG